MTCFPYRCDRLRAFLRLKPVRNRGHVSIWRWVRSIGKQRIHDYSGVFAMAVHRKYIFIYLLLKCLHYGSPFPIDYDLYES